MAREEVSGLNFITKQNKNLIFYLLLTYFFIILYIFNSSNKIKSTLNLIFILFYFHRIIIFLLRGPKVSKSYLKL